MVNLRTGGARSRIPAPAGRFTTGSTMRHVVVMTLTTSLGLTFLFLVDFLTLFYVSLLGDVRLTAAVGVASAVHFFATAIPLGFSVAANVLVGRALGARDRTSARSRATACHAMSFTAAAGVAAVLFLFRHDALGLLVDPGAVKDVASRYLGMILGAIPMTALSMASTATLRAEGDARGALQVTLLAAVTATVLDPILIFAMRLGIDGAAIALVIARASAAAYGLWRVVRVHQLAAPLRPGAALREARPILGVAGPAMLAQLAAPTGFLVLAAWAAALGDGVLAGWSVVTRLTVLAFGGIFAMSSAIGGVFGQNFGAGKTGRVVATYRDSVTFCAVYSVAVWAILALAADLVARGFGLPEDGAEVMRTFCRAGTAAFIFMGPAYVCSVSFNSLGHPLRATAIDWCRNGLAVPALLLLLVGTRGGEALMFALEGPGVVYAQAVAGSMVGVVAGLVGWRFVKGIARKSGSVAAGGGALVINALLAVSGLLAVAQGGGAQTADEGEEPDSAVAPLVADRPDFTEAATTVGRGVLQIEFGYTFGREGDDGGSARVHSLGEPLLRAGILTDRLELRVGAGPVTERTSRDGITASDTGMEDLYLGLKLALREQDGIIPALAILPQITVPTGSAGFSSDRTLPGANVAYGWDVTDNLALAGSTQLNRAAGDSGDPYAEWAQSATVGASLGSRAGAYGEWFAFFPSGTEAAPTEHYFNTGLTLLASDDVQWDIRIGVGLNEPAEDLFAGTGVAVRIR